MEWYTITELADKLKIPDATIRRYVRQHGHHLQIRKKSKSYQIANVSLPVLSKIRELYMMDGMTVDQVDEALAAAHVPIVMTVDDVNDHGEVVTVNVPQALSSLEKSVNDRMNEQMEFNKLLLQRLDEQQAYIENVLKDRDEKLMAGLRQLAASREEVQAKKKWWRFGK